MKKLLESELLIYPCPVILVTTKWGGFQNILTVSWAGIASSHPEFITIAINKKRYSHALIVNSGYFVANIINDDLLYAADYCGSYSGRDHDKFSDCNFTISSGYTLDVPVISECPVNIECKVDNVIDLGSHDLIIGKVLAKLINDDISDEKIHEKLNPLVYFRPNYYGLDKRVLGRYGQIALNDMTPSSHVCQRGGQGEVSGCGPEVPV